MVDSFSRWQGTRSHVSFADLGALPAGAKSAGEAKPGAGHDPGGVQSMNAQKQKEVLEKVKEAESTAGMSVNKQGTNALMGPDGYDQRLADPALRWCLPARPVPAVAGRKGKMASMSIKVPLCSRRIPDSECNLAMIDGELKVDEANLDLSPPAFTGCKHPMLKEELKPGAAKKVKGFLFKCNAPTPNPPEADREANPGEMTDQQEAEAEEKQEAEMAMEGMDAIWALAIPALVAARVLQAEKVLQLRPNPQRATRHRSGGVFL